MTGRKSPLASALATLVLCIPLIVSSTHRVSAMDAAAVVAVGRFILSAVSLVSCSWLFIKSRSLDHAQGTRRLTLLAGLALAGVCWAFVMPFLPGIAMPGAQDQQVWALLVTVASCVAIVFFEFPNAEGGYQRDGRQPQLLRSPQWGWTRIGYVAVKDGCLIERLAWRRRAYACLDICEIRVGRPRGATPGICPILVMTDRREVPLLALSIDILFPSSARTHHKVELITRELCAVCINAP